MKINPLYVGLGVILGGGILYALTRKPSKSLGSLLRVNDVAYVDVKEFSGGVPVPEGVGAVFIRATNIAPNEGWFTGDLIGYRMHDGPVDLGPMMITPIPFRNPIKLSAVVSISRNNQPVLA
jgi:hypothetical protein